MLGIKITQRLLRRRLNRETRKAISAFGSASQTFKAAVSQQLSTLKAAAPTVAFGKTTWGQDVALPASHVMSHGLVLGASGAGKSFFAVQLISQLLDCGFVRSRASFGVLDAKGELFDLVKRYLFAALYRMNPEERQALKRRIVVIDFADDQRIAPYNILVRREYCADEMMVANRIDTIGEQFAGVSAISVRMKLILKYLLLLMVEFELPLPFFEELCVDELLLRSLAERSRNAQVKDYFLHRFDDENRSSLLAIRQRIDSLLVSQSVRLSLSASTAPDLTALQDTGSIILVNTAGRTITRGTSELLESFILSDLKQSVFRRTNVERKFLWLIDEAQTIFRNSSSAENAVDLLTMARSFGSFLVLLTQSLTSATRDQDILNSITGNVRWIVLLRSTLRDAGLIAPAIPLTGARHKSKPNPFEHTQHMSESEELKSRLADVTMFPDRTAYCWFKAYLDHGRLRRRMFLSPTNSRAAPRSNLINSFSRNRWVKGYQAPKSSGLSKNTVVGCAVCCGRE